MFRRLVIDSGLENKVDVKDLTTRYSINQVIVSTYYPLINSIIERGYKLIIDVLVKITNSRYSL